LFSGILGVDVNDALSDGDLLGRILDTFVVAQLRAERALPSRNLGFITCVPPKDDTRSTSLSKSAHDD
jgi:hypothetical protein